MTIEPWDGTTPNRDPLRAIVQKAPDYRDFSATIKKINDLIVQININEDRLLSLSGEVENLTEQISNLSTLKTRIGHFASPGAIGNYSVTGLGFKPKAIEFIGHKNDGWQTWFFHSQGFAGDQGNQNVSTLAGNYSNLFRGDCAFDKCIYLRNTAGAYQVLGTLVSMDDDGFTLNFTYVNPAFSIRYMAIG